jgi:hypothetical protein
MALREKVTAMMASGMELYTMFFILAGVYFVMMLIGHLLLKKPDGWHEEVSTEKDPHPIKTFFSKFKVFKDKTFIGVWLVFYINITCGLAIISNEKELIKMVGLAPALIGTICAVFNAGGRLGYSALADGMKDRNTMYKIIVILMKLKWWVVRHRFLSRQAAEVLKREKENNIRTVRKKHLREVMFSARQWSVNTTNHVSVTRAESM